MPSLGPTSEIQGHQTEGTPPLPCPVPRCRPRRHGALVAGCCAPCFLACLLRAAYTAGHTILCLPCLRSGPSVPVRQCACGNRHPEGGSRVIKSSEKNLRNQSPALLAAALFGLCGWFSCGCFNPAHRGQTGTENHPFCPDARREGIRPIQVASAEELANACKTSRPGDILVLANGTYKDQHFVMTGHGERDRPITLRAQTPGQVILRGSSRLSIAGAFLVVDGLLFRGGALSDGSIITFDSPDRSPATDCMLRNTAIIDYNPPDMDTRYFWVSLHGDRNRIEHCLFSGQAHSGVTVCVWLRDGRPARHVIRHNHFANRLPGNANGFESIRIGTSKTGMTSAECIVEENLFDRCDGEIEIISNKSCGNIYRNNTFYRCAGCLTLRHGNACEVSGNLFLGESAKGTGGVRVIGEGHRISNNYFACLDGRAGGCISIYAGIPNSPATGYARVVNCTVDCNTFVRNRGASIALGTGYNTKGRTQFPEHIWIGSNLMLQSKNSAPAIHIEDDTIAPVWRDNIVVGGDPPIELPVGVRHAVELPSSMKWRMHPARLEPKHVGPRWLPTTPSPIPET